MVCVTDDETWSCLLENRDIQFFQYITVGGIWLYYSHFSLL